MDTGSLLFVQLLNGLQYGVMLFLMAAGLTLVFGIMNLINLAHGSLYMIGAYVFAWSMASTGSLLLSVALALLGVFVIGLLIEVVIFRVLAQRDHLDQVLATFGLILLFNEGCRMVWGRSALNVQLPPWLAGQVHLLDGITYPTYRLVIIFVGLLVALLLHLIISRTRLGMLIRAGASNRVMVNALGVNIKLLYTLVFGLGAVLAGLSGVMAGPIFAVESGMGDNFLILVLVVIVIGGIGSIKGAFIASLAIGVVDTLGRTLLKPALGSLVSDSAANSAGPAIASMLIYLLMAAILFARPQGLFPPKVR
ncbi:branched-chain amino acid ABC transporter permease [Pusillimonas noertemannii]|uniref:Amino acid/amide ABC transporter membrane protein 1 (HAAT family) n=1 Tax=Pusillimonas noertemannii TaxID=305977 RepID=A0A2U1CH03_9BURK|nr:branched-chain amino acid ABC transporter permease [Pusillimonas noertemannii]NYT68214.1 branched-chain amino acid ABC transporter permease [Pusillimonas noertemannii]PVY60184.1 amino acid/amide ABC transporter membrane protein 1 (HAAT family) [Pusillimonas noertemannii]TFL10295.1 branched-chain amino acid ABC transporter permease [Pusillimonas noertemannii]